MKTLTAGPEYGIQPTLDVDVYATYQHSQAGSIAIPEYILSTDHGIYYSNLETNDNAKISPVFNSASPFIGQNSVILSATQHEDAPIYLFTRHKINSKSAAIKIYKVSKDDLRLGVFNPQTTYVWSLNWSPAEVSAQTYHFLRITYYPILGDQCFFIYGQNECLVIDLGTKTVKRYPFYSDTFKLSGFYPAVIFSVTQTSPTIKIYFLDLNSASGTPPTYCGTLTQESNQYGVDFAEPCSDGFYLYYCGTPDTSPLYLAKITNNSTGAIVASKTASTISRRVRIDYGGGYTNEQLLDPNPVTITGATYTFKSYYRNMTWNPYMYDGGYSYLGGCKGMGGATFKKRMVLNDTAYTEFSSATNSTTITTTYLIPTKTPLYFVDETEPLTIAKVYGAYQSHGANTKTSVRDTDLFEYSTERGWRELWFTLASYMTEFTGDTFHRFYEFYTNNQYTKIMAVCKINR